MNSYQRPVKALVKDMRSREMLGDIEYFQESKAAFKEMLKDWEKILRKIFPEKE